MSKNIFANVRILLVFYGFLPIIYRKVRKVLREVREEFRYHSFSATIRFQTSGKWSHVSNVFQAARSA